MDSCSLLRQCFQGWDAGGKEEICLGTIHVQAPSLHLLMPEWEPISPSIWGIWAEIFLFCFLKAETDSCPKIHTPFP